ncbi:MAG: C25 family cysteine peptidase [Thermoplasmatota archaeon]
MKKIKIIAVVFLLLSVLLLPVVSSFQGGNDNEIMVSYFFGEPSMNVIMVGDTTYDTIHMKNTISAADPGKPVLPICGAYILLPPDSTYADITVQCNKQITLDGTYDILPASRPVPKTATSTPSIPEKDPLVYQSSSPFPKESFDVVGTYVLKGYIILVLNLYPVQYIPTTGEIIYYQSIDVSITCKEKQSKTLPISNQLGAESEIVNRVDNPDLLSLYKPEKQQMSSLDSYDMLILTTESLKNSFIPLKNAHDGNGVLTRIKTLSDISLLTDSITTEDIRDFIRDEYLEHGIRYVLLGGDADIVPDRILWVEGMDEEKWHMETFLPSDMYYGCLDGPYNFDGDDQWGEPTDGENGGDVDLFAEVYVGRAPVDSTADVDRFVTKTIAYMQENPNAEYLNKVLMAGEHLGDYGIASWGGNYLDLMIDASSADGYNTTGIPSDRYQIETLYDRDWPETNDWPAEELVNRINNGIHILNHDGHAYYQYNMKMTIYDIDSLNNDKFFFDYSVGCMSGGFDNPNGGDCFAEYITVKTDHGAFAAIMNARYGYFWSYSTDGDGTRFSREFWDAVYGENIPVISHANQDSKEDNLFLIDRSCMRWTYYELNLFGDPSVAFHTSIPPEKPARPQGKSTGKPGVEHSFSSSTIDVDGDNVSYLFSWGDGSDSGWLGPYQSGEQVTASHIWNEKGSYTVQVKAKDESGVESPWSDPLPIKMPLNYRVDSLYSLFFSFLHRFSFLQ